MNSNKKKTAALIVVGLLAALAVPILLRMVPITVRTHTIDFEAARYGYTPARIIVNRGDTVIVKPTSRDVTHGFVLDGYPVELIIKQQGIAYQKYEWEDDTGKMITDWDKVAEVEFVADKPGKFTYRCTQVCGSGSI